MRLESTHLVLFHIQYGDVNDLLRCARESVKEVGMWQPWAIEDYALRHAQTFLQEAVSGNNADKSHTFAIRTKGGSMVGTAHLTPRTDTFGRTVPMYEISFWIRTPDTKKGFGTEVTQALVNYAINQAGARRVFAKVNSENKAAVRVMQKAGLQLEATLKNAERNLNDTVSDSLIFARTV